MEGENLRRRNLDETPGYKIHLKELGMAGEMFG